VSGRGGKSATARNREAVHVELVRDAYRLIEEIQEDHCDDFDHGYGKYFHERFELRPPPDYPDLDRAEALRTVETAF
jgi:hypothetical protein